MEMTRSEHPVGENQKFIIMKAKLGILLIVAMLGYWKAYSQERTITGKVTSVEDGSALSGVNVVLKGTNRATTTDRQGIYTLEVPQAGGTLIFSFIGLQTKEIRIGSTNMVNVALSQDVTQLSEIITTGKPHREKRSYGKAAGVMQDMSYVGGQEFEHPQWNTEEYDGINENIFHGALKNPLSTFSIDVDAASYSNIRRFIHNGQKPPIDAVRIEEMVNYFEYDYKQPTGDDPFSIYSEVATAPWNSKHKLVHIGLQGKRIPTENLPPSNLVFLIDVSGSMDQPNKLPLLKASFKLLVDQLRQQDRVALVVYAGAAGVPPLAQTRK
jgi:Ca-activated chloride channel family protein